MSVSGQSIRSILWFLLIPLPVTYGIPTVIALFSTSEALDSVAINSIGAIVTMAGTGGLFWCLVEFVKRGHGTPAPYEPPTNLVVSGLYRYTRNPMYASVLTIVIGEALWWANWVVLGYAALLWIGFQAWIMLYEEPGLRRRFGEQYLAYCATVPRWFSFRS